MLSLVAVGAWSEYQAASEKVAREVATLEVLRIVPEYRMEVKA